MTASKIDQLNTGTVNGSPPTLATFPAGAVRDRHPLLGRHVPHPAPIWASAGPRQLRDPRRDGEYRRARCRTAASMWRSRPRSFRTGNRQRDKTVLSAGLLDAGQYPVITFIADQVGGPTLAGILTAHGVSRPITLAIELSATSSRSFMARASTRIDRTEFGVTAYRGLAGRYLDVSVDVRCVRS